MRVVAHNDQSIIACKVDVTQPGMICIWTLHWHVIGAKTHRPKPSAASSRLPLLATRAKERCVDSIWREFRVISAYKRV